MTFGEPFFDPNEPEALTPEERAWLQKMSHEAQPLQLGIMGRRGEFTPIIEDLEELDRSGGVSNDTIMGKVYAHVREVQIMESPIEWESPTGEEN